MIAAIDELDLRLVQDDLPFDANATGVVEVALREYVLCLLPHEADRVVLFCV